MYADEQEIMFMELSARTDTNVQELFCAVGKARMAAAAAIHREYEKHRRVDVERDIKQRSNRIDKEQITMRDTGQVDRAAAAAAAASVRAASVRAAHEASADHADDRELGLYSNQMALITSDCDAMRIHDHQMALITSWAPGAVGCRRCRWSLLR